MMRLLRHRGPDGEGLWLGRESRVGLAHTRLAIIDLSSLAQQPMHSEDGRFSIVFNGEIYNYRELRRELEDQGSIFRSHSDTEVLLEMFRRHGVECVHRLVGMYAFAIWDGIEERLLLSRGPFGIKPLYYWTAAGNIAFASELRALLAARLETPSLSSKSMYDYFCHGTPQEPDTLVSNIRMLPPGAHLVWKDGQTELIRSWQIQFPEESIDQNSAVKRTSTALEESVERHFVSDVPVGIFLSGGIDSTAILALAKRLGKKELHTFCISFEETEFDEGGLAEKTAKHFGTIHHNWRINAKDARQLIPDFFQSIDQPSVDGFNTYCVSKFASEQGIKVVLSGLGGDELFGSYPSFHLVPQLLRWHRRFGNKSSIRGVFGSALRSIRFGNRFDRLGRFFQSSGSTLDAYMAVRSIFSPDDASRLVRSYGLPLPDEASSQRTPDIEMDLANQVSRLEMTRYMLNQLLRDSDVMSMAHGLELRVPLVDIELLRILSCIPSTMRIDSKKSLLLAAVPEIPDWIRDRPKQGFAFPFEIWLKEHWRSHVQMHSRRTGVPLSNWYHQWSIFAMDAFLRHNNLGNFRSSL